MAYPTEITVRAEMDLAAIYGQIDTEDSDAALRRFRNFPVSPSVQVVHVRHAAKDQFKSVKT